MRGICYGERNSTYAADATAIRLNTAIPPGVTNWGSAFRIRAAGNRGADSKLLRAVDLRLLQFVGVIDVDGLPLGVEVDRADASLAMSIAGGLRATEG